jgi:hypothetical protein
MSQQRLKWEGLLKCKCRIFEHSLRKTCIVGKCYCCDLEDMFAILLQPEFETGFPSMKVESVVRKPFAPSELAEFVKQICVSEQSAE